MDRDHAGDTESGPGKPSPQGRARPAARSERDSIRAREGRLRSGVAASVRSEPALPPTRPGQGHRNQPGLPSMSELSYEAPAPSPIGVPARKLMMNFPVTLDEEITMGENKGHGTKGPSYDQLNDMDTNVQRDRLNQEQQGNLQSGQQQGSQQSGQQQGSQQSGQRQQGSQQSGQQQGSQQSGQQQQGSQQSGQQQGSQQSGQQGSQQRGGQHASGGTPALDDLGSQQGESAKDASQAWSQDNSIDKQRGNR